MPTLANMEIPRPKSWDEFQDIATSALKARWKSPNLQQYGRQGQAQDGVDIVGPDDLGQQTGVQCKLTDDELSFTVVEEEVAKAEKFEPPLQRYYIATTGKRDSKIQARVRVLSTKRVAKGLFGVGIIFWDDLVQDLLDDPQAFKKHYPQLASAETAGGQSRLAALDLAYEGYGVMHTMDLIFGELGRFSGENPGQYDGLIYSVQATARGFCSPSEHSALCSQCDDLLRAVHEGDWDRAKVLATQIEGRVNSLEHAMKGDSRAAFTLGRMLRRWDIAELNNRGLGAESLDRLHELALKASGAQAAADKVLALAKQFDAAPDDLRAIHLAHKAYNVVRKQILLREL